MAPKRAKARFSPPRPGKSKSSKTGSKASADAVHTKRKRPAKATASKRSRIASTTESEGDSEDGNPSNAASEADEDDNNSQSAESSSPSVPASPEPDFMLAEIVQDTSKQEPAIGRQLLHRIMQEHWDEKKKTKISTDAREVVGKYVEVFVREAIMRSAYERNEREAGGNDGWLEVEDLERIAPQLCLDF